MFTANSADTLLGQGRFAITLARPNGDILYENELARNRLYPNFSQPGHSLLPLLTVPWRWNEIIEKLLHDDPVSDEPVFLLSEREDAEPCYLTAFPQFNAVGELDSVICVWTSRRQALTPYINPQESESVTEYTRNLEALLEHRTYQQLLTSEQNEFARDVLDALPMGILLLDTKGEIVYRNRAMSDLFGLQTSEFLKPNIFEIFPRRITHHFLRVVETGLRAFGEGKDLGGKDTALDFLPLQRAGQVQRVAIVFSRSSQGNGPENNSNRSAL